MNIKNYTSSVTASISMAKIEECLVEIGASNINKKYHDKICTGISFIIMDKRTLKPIAFQLKAQVKEAFTILIKQVKRQNPDATQKVLDQANRTAWKILSDWTEIQCSMIILGQAEPLQMFLPFVYDMNTDQTLYDKVISGKLKLLSQ